MENKYKMIAILGLMAFFTNAWLLSLAPFNMFVGGAVGTSINEVVIETGSLATIYIGSAIILFLVSLVAALFISQIEVQNRQGSFEENL